jgi:hypothetical protein
MLAADPEVIPDTDAIQYAAGDTFVDLVVRGPLLTSQIQELNITTTAGDFFVSCTTSAVFLRPHPIYSESHFTRCTGIPTLTAGMELRAAVKAGNWASDYAAIGTVLATPRPVITESNTIVTVLSTQIDIWGTGFGDTAEALESLILNDIDVNATWVNSTYIQVRLEDNPDRSFIPAGSGPIIAVLRVNGINSIETKVGEVVPPPVAPPVAEPSDAPVVDQAPDSTDQGSDSPTAGVAALSPILGVAVSFVALAALALL